MFKKNVHCKILWIYFLKNPFFVFLKKSQNASTKFGICVLNLPPTESFLPLLSLFLDDFYPYF